MQTFSRFLFPILACLTFLPACDADAPTDEVGDLDDVEFRNEFVFWDSITCMLGTTRCYGHRPTADELWSPLLSECELQKRIDDNGWIETEQGWFATCDYGGTPETFPDSRCFWVNQTKITCFGGDNGWYTEVSAACEVGGFTTNNWPGGYCETDFGYHEYDDVGSKWSAPVTGRAFDAGDRFTVIDDCSLAGGGNPAPYPFACMDSCCRCHPDSDIAECYGIPDNGACPDGWDYGPLTCTP
jgi:hypothetical protein